MNLAQTLSPFFLLLGLNADDRSSQYENLYMRELRTARATRPGLPSHPCVYLYRTSDADRANTARFALSPVAFISIAPVRQAVQLGPVSPSTVAFMSMAQVKQTVPTWPALPSHPL